MDGTRNGRREKFERFGSGCPEGRAVYRPHYRGLYSFTAKSSNRKHASMSNTQSAVQMDAVGKMLCVHPSLWCESHVS